MEGQLIRVGFYEHSFLQTDPLLENAQRTYIDNMSQWFFIDFCILW